MKISSFLLSESKDSAVGIETGYGPDSWGVKSSSPCRGVIFLFSTLSGPILGATQLQWVPGALSLGVKRPGHEADHSPPTSDEVKNTWIYTSTHPYSFTAYCLIS
jgi:hypothetical protein